MNIMKRIFMLAVVVFVVVPAAFSQSEYRKWEFFGGYSIMQFDNIGGNTNNAAINDLFGEKNNLRGLNVSITRNIHKYVGIKGDYSLHLREDNFTRPQGSGTVDTTVHNVLGGLQFKDNATDARFKPFAHAMVGFANQKEDVDSPQLQAVFGLDDFSANETSFAMVFGGGLDIRLNHRIDVRAIQADWNIITRGDQVVGTTLPPGPSVPFVIPGMTQNNLRLSFGIVIH